MLTRPGPVWRGLDQRPHRPVGRGGRADQPPLPVAPPTMGHRAPGTNAPSCLTAQRHPGSGRPQLPSTEPSWGWPSPWRAPRHALSDISRPLGLKAQPHPLSSPWLRQGPASRLIGATAAFFLSARHRKTAAAGVPSRRIKSGGRWVSLHPAGGRLPHRRAGAPHGRPESAAHLVGADEGTVEDKIPGDAGVLGHGACKAPVPGRTVASTHLWVIVPATNRWSTAAPHRDPPPAPPPSSPPSAIPVVHPTAALTAAPGSLCGTRRGESPDPPTASGAAGWWW